MNNEIKKDMRGVYFPNQNKNKPTQPDFSGKALIKGITYKVAIWENRSTDGKTYYSVIYSEDEQGNKNNGIANKKETSSEIDELNDILKITENTDIPF